MSVKRKMPRLLTLHVRAMKVNCHRLIHCVIVSCAAFACQASADALIGRVVSVTDGDTIMVLTSSRDLFTVRLMGIDAPEKRQDFGLHSKRHLSDLLFNQAVDVEWNKKDRYGRIVGKVLLRNEDINLKQIQAGLAWWYQKYQFEQSASDRVRYRIAEQEAQERQQGLWSQPSPTPPWDWRHRTRK